MGGTSKGGSVVLEVVGLDVEVDVDVVLDVVGVAVKVCILQPRAGGTKLSGLLTGFSLVVVVIEVGKVDVVSGGICDPGTVVVVSLASVVDVVGAAIGGNALWLTLWANTEAEVVRATMHATRATRNGQTRSFLARRSARFTVSTYKRYLARLIKKGPGASTRPFFSQYYFNLPFEHQRLVGSAAPLLPLTRQGFGIVEYFSPGIPVAVF